jgi:hypothetical protein
MTAFVYGLQLEPWQAVEPRKASLVFVHCPFFLPNGGRVGSVDWLVIAITFIHIVHRETLVSYTTHADLFPPSA